MRLSTFECGYIFVAKVDCKENSSSSLPSNVLDTVQKVFETQSFERPATDPQSTFFFLARFINPILETN
jgi:hypothetical protein